MGEQNTLSKLEDLKKIIRELEEPIPHEGLLRIDEAIVDIERSLEERISKLDRGLNWLELPVGELESEVTKTNGATETTVWIRLKGQRPDDKCLLNLPVEKEHLKVIHEAKQRGGTVWVRFTVGGDTTSLEGGTLVVRDILE